MSSASSWNDLCIDRSGPPALTCHVRPVGSMSGRTVQRVMLKSPPVIVLLSVSLFRSFNICSVYLGASLLSTYLLMLRALVGATLCHRVTPFSVSRLSWSPFCPGWAQLPLFISAPTSVERVPSFYSHESSPCLLVPSHVKGLCLGVSLLSLLTVLFRSSSVPLSSPALFVVRWLDLGISLDPFLIMFCVSM